MIRALLYLSLLLSADLNGWMNELSAQEGQSELYSLCTDLHDNSKNIDLDDSDSDISTENLTYRAFKAASEYFSFLTLAPTLNLFDSYLIRAPPALLSKAVSIQKF